MPKGQTAPKDQTSVDLHERIAFAMTLPLARLAGRFRIPLRRVKQLSELAYYQEMRRRGLRMAQIQEVMSVGFSKVGTLSRQFKDYHAMSGAEVGLQRRILLLLWAAPLTQKHILGALPDEDPEQVLQVLTQMVQQAQLILVQGRTARYQVATQHNPLLKDQLLVRLSALQSLMTNVAQTVHARFLPNTESGEAIPAFVRTLNFRMRPEDLPKLERFYREALFPLIEELDGAVSSEQEDTLPIKLSFLWSQDTDRDEAEPQDDPAGTNKHSTETP